MATLLFRGESRLLSYLTFVLIGLPLGVGALTRLFSLVPDRLGLAPLLLRAFFTASPSWFFIS
jgi:hypothetical protein